MADKKKNTPPDKKTKAQKDAFPVVCLGASAGGLKALETFLANLPEKNGISFVVITQTDPDRASMLPKTVEGDGL
jgi:two-component system CheB/CheR fusion protein